MAIADVLARYNRAVDDESMDDAAALFADDGTLHAMGQSVTGRANLRGIFGASSPTDRPSSLHHTANVVVECDGDTATAASDLVVLRRSAEGDYEIKLAGRYLDRLRYVDGEGWRLAERTVQVLQRGRPGPVDTTPGAPS